MNKRLIAAGLLLLGTGFLTLATAETDAEKQILETFKKVYPGVKPDSISPSPMAGVSEVLMGPRLLYVSNDGKFMLQGSLIDLKTRKDVSETRRSEIRLDALEKLGEDKMIVFPAKDEKYTISVFTDIDCGYCRKLHHDMAGYNAAGITVRYLMFPRGGLKSAAYDKSVTVWCSEDQQAAMTKSKNGQALPKLSCDNPVKEEYELGKLLGVRGTPAIVMDDGTLLPGYVPPKRLSAALAAGAS